MVATKEGDTAAASVAVEREASSATPAEDYAALAEDMLRRIESDADITEEELGAIRGTKFESRFSARVAVGIVAALLVAMLGSFMVGRYSMNPLDVITTLWYALVGDYGSIDGGMYRSMFNIRLPRIFIVIMVGAALAMAGASYQGMFKNPLTSPDLLGASAGASVGACLGLLLNLGGDMVQVFAFVGGLVAVGMTVWLTRFVDYEPMLGLVLAGILVSTLFQAAMSAIKLLADGDDKLPEITYWLMGSFSRADAVDIVPFLIPMLLGFALLLSQSWQLNVLSFGDDEARALGVNTSRTRLLVILGATLITSVSVAVAGVVGWIGLVVPHLARAIVGPNYRVLLPASMAVGAVFLLLVDDISRLLLAVEIPIGILTAVLGVPFFVFIFRRNMRGW